MSAEPITEDWLRSLGFRWEQHERQPGKHWLLWIGNALVDRSAKSQKMFCGHDELGIELAQDLPGSVPWFCWFRSDVSGRYHRFIHLRRLSHQDELVSLIQGLTGAPFDPANIIYGGLETPEQAARYRAEEEKRRNRLDRLVLESGHPWYESEKDGTRAKPSLLHVDGAIKAGLAK